MALKHAQPLDVIDLHASDAAVGTDISSSLLKTPRLQLMRVRLAAGQALPEHHAPAEVTIQCVAGAVDVVTATHSCALHAGSLVMLPAAEPHRVQAHQESMLLVTMLRP